MFGVAYGLNEDGLLGVPFRFNIGVTEAVDGFFVRDKPGGSTIYGPLSFLEAHTHAQWISTREEGEGIAEIVSYVGVRPGDPRMNPPKLVVNYIYMKGKRTLGGRAAQFNSGKV